MAEELLITPEITMHEEPGEIRINQGSGQVAVEIGKHFPIQVVLPTKNISSIKKTNKTIVCTQFNNWR